MRPSLRTSLLVLSITAGACNTPSVPLPPPLLQALSFQEGPQAGQVVITGTPELRHADARFYVYNQSMGDGVIVTAAHDGSFSAGPFGGNAGDLVQLYYDSPAG